MSIFGELPDISNEDASSVEGHEDEEEEEVVLEDDVPHPFSQKELNDLVNGLCRTVGIQIEEKKPPH